ncbi:DHA2 family efflux MFS transporter permease subunit [Occultella glacieicola]|uniref:DHA2 family efflux MFS transporter permease subunit n=1 Tax=Occultella glacieicola TaxID=2518684 RepID=A0ABY2E590_9MICO|nr:MDR family MFS transporter [Occultella glacieicola]TDE92587.1 DHA2 family efflux MFS transporter permease subunit [Occultella glacieicola]
MPGTTPSPYAAAPAGVPERLEPSTRLVITLLLVSSFVVILNETIMSVAIPNIMSDLHIEASTGQWLSTSFLLTMAVVIPITGYLLQRFNTRPIFLAAMTLFSAGTLIAAVSPTFGLLIVGRVVQASGTAMMMPLLMTTLMTVVPATLRGRTMGNVSIVMAVAPAVGPAISGLVLSVLPWKWLFWLVLPIAIGALVLGALRVPNVSTPKRVPLDLASVILSGLAFGGLIYGLSGLGEAARETPPVPLAIPIGGGALALVLFVLRQLRLQREDRALLDLRVFTSRSYSVSLTLMVLLMMSLFGTIILLPLYLQNVLRLETVTIGLMLLPGGLAMGLLGPVVGRLYDRFGPRPLVVPGAVIVSGALWSMTLLTEHSPALQVLAGHVVLSLGLGLMFTPLFTTALGSLRPSLYSHGSAVLGTLQQFAGAAGTALFVVLMTVSQVNALDGGATEVHATAVGTRTAFTCGAVLSLVVIVAALFVRRPDEPEEAAAPEHETPVAVH